MIAPFLSFQLFFKHRNTTARPINHRFIAVDEISGDVGWRAARRESQQENLRRSLAAKANFAESAKAC